jgi:hypothetical protein
MTEFSKDSRVHGSRRSNYKQEGLIEHFGASTTARTAAGKVPVFGILKRGGKVYIKVIPDVRSGTLWASWSIKLSRTALCTATHWAVTTPRTCRISGTFEPTTVSCWQTVRTRSTGSRISRTRRGVICAGSTAFRGRIFRCIRRNAKGV